MYMQVEIMDNRLDLDLHGFTGSALNKDYAGTAFKLMDRMWKIVRDHGLKNKGLNTWVYGPGEIVFAGVELTETPSPDTGLEHKRITLERYACFKHIGPYALIKESGQKMRDELKQMGLETVLPYIEIYGHWTNDETKLETELLMGLK